jgi:hypothetical protein
VLLTSNNEVKTKTNKKKQMGNEILYGTTKERKQTKRKRKTSKEGSGGNILDMI